MATEERGNSSTVVAIVAMMLLLSIGTLVAWRMGVFSRDRGDTPAIDVKVR